MTARWPLNLKIHKILNNRGNALSQLSRYEEAIADSAAPSLHQSSPHGESFRVIVSSDGAAEIGDSLS